MLGFERKKIITNLIMQAETVRVSDLAKRFDVSVETIRRDLAKLEESGILTRTHGGAKLNQQTNQDLPYFTRNWINKSLKNDIAQKALQLIPDNATLMCDSSSTVFEMINTIQENRKNVTVITNSIDILYSFMYTDLQLVSTGGLLRKHSQSMIGRSAKTTLEHYNADYGIFSCKGLSIESGVMDATESDSEIKELMSSKVDKIILVVDSSKFDTKSLINVFPINKIDYIITDHKPSQKWMDYCEENKIKLMY